MAVNYATKYSAQVDECFQLASVTTGAVNDKYTFDGVETKGIQYNNSSKKILFI